MKKKLISIFLVIALLFSILPHISIGVYATTSSTIDALNNLLIGAEYSYTEHTTDVSKWSDETICDMIWGKLLWDSYQYSDYSYLHKADITFWNGNDGYLHFNLEAIQKITQDTLGRDFPSNTQSEYIFVSGDELLIVEAIGESRTLAIQDFVQNGSEIIAVGTAVYNYNADSEYLGYFQAIFEENPSSIYGYTLVSLSHIDGNQSFNNLTANASSELKETSITHDAKRVLDGDLGTAWVEGVTGLGVNEWIKLETTDGSKINVSAIEFSMGYQKNNQTMRKNGWPCKVLIECEGGYQQEAEFYNYSDIVVLNQSATTSWIRITILEANQGMQYEDTCISEISLKGINTSQFFSNLNYPTGSNSTLIDGKALKDKYGMSSQEQFVSCLGTDIQLYPTGIYGIVSMVPVDLNDDNVDELVVLRVSEKENKDEAQIIAEVYQGTNGYMLSDSQFVYSVSFCAAANLYLFYSDVLGEYCLMIESYSSGSYTGVSSWEAKVFTITEESIESYAYWESVPFVGIYTDFEAELKAINAPYAKYCTEYENFDNGLYYQPLCEIEHETYGDTSSYSSRNHKLTIKSISGTQVNAVKDNGLVVFSDYTNLSVRKDSIITLSAGIRADGELIDDVSGITFQIEDTSILSVSSTGIEDSCRYVRLKGLSEGTTTVVFNDTNTGLMAKVPVTVYDNNYLSYTLNSVPTQNIEKYPTNVYNANGLYVDSYKYTVNDDQSAVVSFDVYNTNYTYGVVEVYDEKGNMKDAVLIEKMTSSNTSIKEAVWDNIGYLVRDIIDGDLLSYRQESGYTKKTSVSVKIPQNGYIKISTDPEKSLIVGLVNSVDSLMSMASLAGDVKDFDVSSKAFSKKLTAKLLADQVYLELLKDGDDASKKLWKNVGKETFITSDSMGSFTNTITKNLDELKLGSIIADTAADFGWDVGENVFTYFSGPAGVALNVIFTIGKVENLIIQQNDLIKSAGVGSIYIQNQGGGLRSCQQIKVVSEDEFSSDTALNVFTVTLDSAVLDVIKALNPEVYEAITNGITYTYNISLLQNGDETQPDGKVTVYIPIPEEFLALAYAGELTGGAYDKVKIYRIEEDGSLTEMDVEVEDGCFVFTTDHFSLYTIVGYDGWENAPVDQGKLDISPMLLVGVAAAIITIMGMVVVIKRKKK